MAVLRSLLAVSAVFSAGIAHADEAEEAVAASASADVIAELESLRWEKRLLLVPEEFALSQTSRANPDQMQERDVQLVVYSGDGIILRPFETDADAADFVVLKAQGADDILRDHYGFPATYTALIGKDGTTKQAFRRFARQAHVNDIIDSMPMRQKEMRSPGGD